MKREKFYFKHFHILDKCSSLENITKTIEVIRNGSQNTLQQVMIKVDRVKVISEFNNLGTVDENKLITNFILNKFLLCLFLLHTLVIVLVSKTIPWWKCFMVVL